MKVMSMRSTLVDAFYSLSAKINKRSGDTSQENAEGVIGARLPELTLDRTDDELIKLSNTWERVWKDSDVYTKWDAAGDENEKYWKGEHYSRPEVESTRAIKDNAIFEGLETYLPQVTRRNPEASVVLANGVEQTEPNRSYAQAIQVELNSIADDIRLRLKLKGAARHQSVRLLGVIKLGWDLDNDLPAVKVLRPNKVILDPEATVDEDGYSGDRIGEYRKLPAWKLVNILEKTKAENSEITIAYITTLAKDDMATEIGFIEWWTSEYTFWKLDTHVLLKRKNPHWNYDQELPTPPQADETAAPEATDAQEPVQAASADQEVAQEGSTSPVAPEGAPALPQLDASQEGDATVGAPAEPMKGVNHFKSRKMPYLFLTVYNLGKQPVDVTSLIGQNLSNQDLINKRIKQIDKNADTANGGLVVSLERSGLTKDQSKGVTKALRNGGVVAIPAGAPQEAIYKPPMQELPAYVYNQLVDTRNRVRDIWGTRGSSPAGMESETTVRGKILNKGLDTDRIGGGISENLEQLAEDVFDWIVQLLYVYDDRFVEQWAQGVIPPRINASVKEGSLLPKDSTTIANQAIELSTGGKMSTLDLYKRLEYPNPEELAANVWLEVNAPEILYGNDPRIKQVMAARQASAQSAAKPPNVSINYKDLPPDGQSQAAKQAGIEIHPEGIAVHKGVEQARSEASALPNEQETAAM
jgi:hypothetical protein